MTIPPRIWAVERGTRYGKRYESEYWLKYPDDGKPYIDQQIVDELVEAISGIIRVADRKTIEFDAARTALQRYKSITMEAGDETN